MKPLFKFLLAALIIAWPPMFAHEEEIAALLRVEKVFNAPKPLGNIRVLYVAADNNGAPSLQLNCDTFKGAIPREALEDLPRPDWGSLTVPYSQTSFDSVEKKFVARPYLYIQVPVFGPLGVQWPSTWVHFFFDDEGKFMSRKIKQFVTLPGTNSSKVVWKEWPSGKGLKPENVLRD